MAASGNERTALVLFGSETGNAEDVAVELGKLSQRLHFVTKVIELNDVAPQHLCQYTIVLCVVSTTGQGDLPANAQRLWKKLRSVRLQPGCFAQVKFASFGLGDSSYPKFNWAHRKLFNRLTQLGAKSICDRGEADEQHPEGIDGTLLPWLSTLHGAITENFPLPDGLSPVSENEFLIPKWQLSEDSTSFTEDGLGVGKQFDNKSMHHHGDASLPESTSTHLIATLVQNVRVTPDDHWQDVRVFEFATKPPVDYNPGDVVSILPKNDPEDVEVLLNLMDWTTIADAPLRFKPTDPDVSAEYYPPTPIGIPEEQGRITLRKLLNDRLDINAIPRRSFFSSIAHFTNDESHKERLIEFTDPELIDELYDYTTRPRRSIIEVLQEFDTVKIPWKWVASVIPTIKPRQFSIASGGALKRNADGLGKIELLVAIVKYRTVIKKIRRGLCTRYLAGLEKGATLEIQLCRGGMRLSLDRPAVMVGPGTGIAPLRSMIYERVERFRQQATPAASVLFFGGRNRLADFFFETEWSTLQQQTALELFPAFSRDQSSKIYVQDLIRKHGHLVFTLLQTGVVYVCGSSGKMPQAVREALIETFEQYGNMSREAAESHFVQMEKAGRYQQETW